MSWAIIAELIVKIGIPATAALIDLWSNKTAVTPEEFTKIRALAQQSASDRMKKVLAESGVDLESDQAKALLALVN